VPARSKSISTAASQSSIVLLEEYDALGAAIGSALRKFAPQHNVAVARSIQELEKFADDLAPELFIFDVDPPWKGLTNFLEEVRDSHGSSRALVIGGAIPPEITAQRGSSGALQFIEKPFDLTVFGAAVQALLGPWPQSESRGTMRALGAVDLVLLHCAARASVVLEIRSRARTGEIQIATGEVSHAETGKLKGEDALAEILSWTKTHAGERKITGSAQRTIGTNWPAIILEALLVEESEIPAPAPPTPGAPPKAEKKIVVIDDTEMLLIFVEDVLATAEPTWQFTTAPNATEGLRVIDQVQPDLVLLDYNLPDFNGDELCRQLLQNERTAHVPILMMSGHIQQMNATAARFPNVVATIEKPFLSDALVDLVRRTIATEHRFEKQIEEPRVEPPALVVEPEPIAAPQPPTPPPTIPLRPPARSRPSPPAPQRKVAVEPPARPHVAPTLAPLQSHIERHAPVATTAVRVAPTDGNAAILGIFLEVLSMQLTSQLQMGAIRARPSSLIGSLRLESASARSAIPSELGFQLGPIKLNGEGQISTMRLIPTAKPFQPAQTRTAFEIGGVALIPNETRARVQLTPAGTTPMTMELFAHLELSSVELSASFQVAQLILNWNTNAVRVTLNPKAPEQSAAKFEMRVLKLDDSSRISELLLSPVR
jgi:DNA-binding response OmpR family regulator